MRYFKAACFGCLLVWIAGCSTQYGTVKQTKVTTVRTDSGEEIKTEEESFVSYAEVIERSPNVKSVTRITDLKGEREPFFYALSPTGKELVYQALESVEGEKLINFWKIPTSGGAGMTRLTVGRYFDLEPSYSPSGSDILFASNRSSASFRLFRIRADGAGGITRVTQSDAEDRTPVSAPSGDAIFYASKPFNSQTWQVWRIGANGALPTQFKEGLRPRVSPDGKQVLYCAQERKSSKWKIWLMDIEGMGETELTSGIESDELYPDWSPDGGTIVFASDMGKDSNGKKNFDIWMMKADGSNKTQLTTNGSTDFLPIYSPDGKFIYFLSNRGGHSWDIWRMEVVE